MPVIRPTIQPITRPTIRPPTDPAIRSSVRRGGGCLSGPRTPHPRPGPVAPHRAARSRATDPPRPCPANDDDADAVREVPLAVPFEGTTADAAAPDATHPLLPPPAHGNDDRTAHPDLPSTVRDELA